MADPISLNDEQLRQIVGAVNALKPIGGIQWETVVPVFVSALLAMCVGISLEYFKSAREAKKAALKRQKDELTEINIATIALAFQFRDSNSFDLSKYSTALRAQVRLPIKALLQVPHIRIGDYRFLAVPWKLSAHDDDSSGA